MVTSFACLHGNIVHHKDNGIKEVSNLHRIPVSSFEDCVVDVGNVIDAPTFSFGSVILTVGVTLTVLGMGTGVIG